MDFKDSPQEAEFRKEVNAWFSANAKPRDTGDGSLFSMFSERESEDGFIEACKAWRCKKAEAGWGALTWPEAYGGRGGTLMENIIFQQEEAKFSTPADVFLIGVGLTAPTLMMHGTEAQKQQHLPGIMRGDDVWCQLFSEPGAGSDLAGLRTKAVKDGDDWVINGQKVWTSGAHYSDWGILVTRTDFDAPKHKGLTYFVVDMKTPGIDIRPIKQITGGANFNEVFLTDVRIPDANRIDAVGNGWAVALTTLMNERMSIGGAMGVEPMAFFDQLEEIASRSYIDGELAKDNAAVKQRIAHFYTSIKAMELTVNRTLSALSKGGMPGSESSIVKLALGQVLQEAGAFAMELQGGLGVEYGPDATYCGAFWQELYLGIPAARIAGGTDEVQRNIIGERVLGLPPEHRVDKGIAFKDIPA
ncbi:MAG: acyl-CoA dehydrogenase [Gammaproteobacteria bacterium]|nr:MAG: acyl-CoA dehydrogenase [Gammaproteobacteria bacterium]